MRFIARLVLFFGLAISSNSAQSDNLDFFAEAFDATVAASKLIVDKLPKSERAKLVGVKLELVNNPRAVILAMTEKNSKTIYLSNGLMDGLYNYSQCLLLESTYKTKNLCDKYFSYYFTKVTAAGTSPPDPIATIFFEKSAHGLVDWENNEAINRVSRTMLLSALVSIVAHEYGHHAVGFPPADATISEIQGAEAKADAWAFKNLAAIGERPVLGATTSLGYFSQVELYRHSQWEMRASEPDFVQLPASHPQPRVRAMWAYDYSCPATVEEAKLKSVCAQLKRLIDSFE